jgi:hypothetical protein
MSKKIRLIPISDTKQDHTLRPFQNQKWIDPITNKTLPKHEINRIESDIKKEREALKHVSKKEESLLKRFLILD